MTSERGLRVGKGARTSEGRRGGKIRGSQLGQVGDGFEVQVAFGELGEVLLLHLDQDVMLESKDGVTDSSQLLSANHVGRRSVDEGLEDSEVLLVTLERVGVGEVGVPNHLDVLSRGSDADGRRRRKSRRLAFILDILQRILQSFDKKPELHSKRSTTTVLELHEVGQRSWLEEDGSEGDARGRSLSDWRRGNHHRVAL